VGRDGVGLFEQVRGSLEVTARKRLARTFVDLRGRA
jgi:hypothetical protein